MRKSLPVSVRLVLALASVAVLPVAGMACGKSPEVPTASVDGGFGGALVDGGAGADAEAGLALGVVPSPDAGADAAPAAPDAGVLATGFDAALDAAIVALAAKDAPGMTSEGQVGHETVQQGGHFGMVVTLQPGRCYTFVAMSAPLQVSELEVKLYMLPLNVEAGRSPASDKNPAVLGKGKGATCPISPIPVPYKIDVTAKKGAGRIAVAVFSKSK
jgi:hypothetical protein